MKEIEIIIIQMKLSTSLELKVLKDLVIHIIGTCIQYCRLG